MSENFYRALNGVRTGLRDAWDKVSGVSMLKKRGLASGLEYHDQATTGMIGCVFGLAGGFFIGGYLESQIVSVALIALGASTPITLYLPCAIYKAGEHDYKLRIEQEKLQELPPPAPQLPAPQKGLI